jgi:riboflavin kinase/FMN adenylyltransferase
MTVEERNSALNREGLDGVVLLPFTRELAGMSAENFLRTVCRRLRPRAICVGENFYFGAGGQGDTDFLERRASEYGYRLKVFPVLKSAGQICSSSLVRKHLSAGRVDMAARILGRPYEATGRVIRGEGQGHGFGYPTANLDPDAIGKLLPRDGVYETRVAFGPTTGRNRRFRPGATFIGPRFGSGVQAFETFIPGFRGNLYGRTLTVRFLRFLRKPEKFRTAGALIHRIQRDVKTIKEA